MWQNLQFANIKCIQAKNVAETVTALMTNLAIAAAVDLVVVVAVVDLVVIVCSDKPGNCCRDRHGGRLR